MVLRDNSIFMRKCSLTYVIVDPVVLFILPSELESPRAPFTLPPVHSSLGNINKQEFQAFLASYVFIQSSIVEFVYSDE